MNQDYLMAALDVLRHRLAGTRKDPDPAAGETATEQAGRRRDEARRAMPAPPALEVIVDGLGLSDFERDLLLLCAGVELDTAFAHACAEAQGDPAHTYATFGLGLASLPGAHWNAISPARPLRRWHLIELTQPEVPTASPLRVDERILHALAGISYLDPRIEPLSEPLARPPSLPPALREAAEIMVARWSQPDPASGPPQVLLHGRRRSDLRSVAAAACLELGDRPVCLRAADLPSAVAERDRLARLCERETVLDGVTWIIDIDDGIPDSGRLALDLAGRLEAPVVLTAREPLSGSGPRLARVEVGQARVGDVRAVWRDALGPAAETLSAWIERSAGQFDLDLDSIRAVADSLPPIGGDGVADQEAAGTLLWDACRRQARPELDDLAQRIEPGPAGRISCCPPRT